VTDRVNNVMVESDVRHAKPGLIPFRRWPRRLLIAANVVVALALAGSGLTYGYVRYRLDSIRTGSSIGLSPTDGGGSNGSGGGSNGSGGSSGAAQSGGGLAPENILLIGNETRAGQTQVNFGNAAQLTGALSDIIMILHLDTKTDTASILSIPRDVFVPMPAGSQVGGYQKIDAALNDGADGPNNLAETITEDFGIPINHYVEVDFDGFLNTVNALGGIKVNFPERLYDAYAGLNITHTGCQLLNGQQALAMVRSRHLQYDAPGASSNPALWPYDPESDLARIVRDHTFIRILASTGEHEGLTNPLKANAFLSAVLGQLTIDPGLKNQLLTLIGHYHNLNPFSAPETTIPVTQVTGAHGNGYVFDGYNVGDVEFPDQPADTQTVNNWDPGALPTPVKPAAVQIYNDVGTANLAADTGTALKSDGFEVTLETDGPVPGSESETVVQYHPGQLADGLAVFEKLTGALTLQSDTSIPTGTVDVQAGSTLAVDTVAADTTPADTTPADTTPADTTSTSTSKPTTVPTPGGQAPSASTDNATPYDPTPC
jgi:LCP family protein required for cell wall assembly